MAMGTGKPDVLVPPMPQSPPMRPHRPLYLMKGLKKDKELGMRTKSGII